MMEAAHGNDLAAAASYGLHTAFVPRPEEFGPAHGGEREPGDDFDVVASDFLDLAAKLGA